MGNLENMMNKMNNKVKKSSSIGLLMGLTVLVLSLLGCGHTQPDEKFLKSSWHFQGGDVTYATVEEFVEKIKNTQMTNGKRFEVIGWKKNDNVYTLHVKAKESIELRFTHILSSPSNGIQSSFDSVKAAGQELSPLLFLETVISNQAEVPAKNFPNSSANSPTANKASVVALPEQKNTVEVAKQITNVEQEGPCKGLDLTVIHAQKECLDRKFNIADSELNNIYKQITSALDSDKKAAFKKAQISWIKEKESKCANAGKEAEGGQMEGVLVADCKLQMTESRTVYLRNYK